MGSEGAGDVGELEDVEMFNVNGNPQNSRSGHPGGNRNVVSYSPLPSNNPYSQNRKVVSASTLIFVVAYQMFLVKGPL